MLLFKPMLKHSNLNEFLWSSHKNINLSVCSRKAFQNIMCKTTAILSQHKCVRVWKSQMLCEHPFFTIIKRNIDMSHPSMKMLTHRPLNKMASISETIFSNAFSWMKNFVFWFKFHWSLNRWQAIIWNNAHPILWHIYAALGGYELISWFVPGCVMSNN